MPHSRSIDLDPRALVGDRWLIEALSQLSSNADVRHAARLWLAAYAAALASGCAEADAQAVADETLQPLGASRSYQPTLPPPSSHCGRHQWLV